MVTQDDEGTRLAIRALAKTASDNEYLGGSGGPPPIAVRVQAAISLGSYVPHREAVEALEGIIRQYWAPSEVREAAARALGKRP